MAKKMTTKNYRNLGELISATDVADEALTYSETIRNTHLYTKAILHCQSTQAWELYSIKVNPDGTEDWGNLMATGLSATSTSTSGVTIDGTTSIFGYGLKFAMKNKSGGATANFNLKVQLVR